MFVEAPPCFGVSMTPSVRLDHAANEAPSQWALPDWTLGSKGCYDDATWRGLGAALHRNMSTFADGKRATFVRPEEPQTHDNRQRLVPEDADATNATTKQYTICVRAREGT